MLLLLSIAVVTLFCFVREVCSYSYPLTDEQRLVLYLTSNYSRLGKPGLSHSTSLMVRTRFFPIKLQSLLEKEEALQMTVRIQLNWKDPALRFNSAQFNNQTSVILPGNSIWVPDLQISNSMSDLYGLLRDPRFDFKVYPDGSVWWHPTGNIATRCEIQLPYFPFDFQRCPIIMESVIYTYNHLNLTLRADKVPWSTSMYAESGHWNLVGIKARSRLKYVTNSTAFTSVEFWIFLRRKSGYYTFNIILPCAMLSALQMLTFFLPLESSERVPEATTILLSVIVFQSMIIQDLPRSSDTLPLLCVYIDLVTGISVVSVGEAVFIAYLVSRKRERRLCPHWGLPFLKLLYRLFRQEPKSLIPTVPSRSEINDQTPERRGFRPIRAWTCRYHSNSHDLGMRSADYAQLKRPVCLGCYNEVQHQHRHEVSSRTSSSATNADLGGLSEMPSHNCCHCNDPNCYYKNQSKLRKRQHGHSEGAASMHLDVCEEFDATCFVRKGMRATRQLSRSSSRLRPVLLAPLARLDDGSDCDSSDLELSERITVNYSNMTTDFNTPTKGENTEDARLRVNQATTPAVLPAQLDVSSVDDVGGLQDSLSYKCSLPHQQSADKPSCCSSRRAPPNAVGFALGDLSSGTPDATNIPRKMSIQLILIDWVFLAKIVDYVTFLCCLFCISGVPVFLFRIVPPESPDYDLD